MSMEMQQEPPEKNREIDARIASILEPQPPSLTGCRSVLHDTASPLGAWVHTHFYEQGDKCVVVPRAFSSELSLAWRVVEKMCADSWDVSISNAVDSSTRWRAGFYGSSADGKYLITGEYESESLPEAICCAALEALVDGNQPKETKVNNEQIEIEDDQRCAECGSTEGGNCFHCKDGLG